jgi:DNA-binding GntR family transcriptional regulator
MASTTESLDQDLSDSILEPLKRETMHSRIRTQLEQRLITGKFRPGDKLPLRTLAAQLGTSLMPVRDAIQHLQSIGALVYQANGSTSVPELDAHELQELCELRLMLESYAAERAIARLDADGKERLHKRFIAMRDSRTQPPGVEYLQANWNFHLEIAELSGMPSLIGLLKSLWLRLGPSVQIGEDERGGRSDALDIHGAIYNGIIEGDLEATRQALKEDIFYDRPRLS